MSSSASRVWMTSGRPISRASAIWARNTRSATSARRIIVVVVETRLADADAFGMRGERRIASKSVAASSRRLMRMGADVKKTLVIALGDRGYPLRRVRSASPIVIIRSTPAARRALDDRVELVGEVGKVEMAVAVDQLHFAASGST